MKYRERVYIYIHIYARHIESAEKEVLTIKPADDPKLGVGMLYHRIKVQNYCGIIEKDELRW